MADAEMVLTPREAARRLGVSPSGLRRLAVVYGEVYGDLEKDAGGTSRVWPHEAVMRLERARALLATGQARSIKDALHAVETGAAPRVEVAVADGRVAEALGVVATRLEAVLEGNRRLEAEVAALRKEVAELRSLPPGATPERIDRALEVEMLKDSEAAERPGAVEERQAVSEVVNGVEPQRREQESWVAEVALEALVGAAELPSEAREMRERDKSTGEALGDAEGSSDGPMVKAARWLERRLRGGRG